MSFNRIRYKLCKDKRVLAGILAGATLAGMGTTFYVRTKNHKINSNSEYVIGYDDVGVFNEITNRVTDNNFVLLDIGDHDHIGTFFQNQKLDYCVSHGIDIGLILTSNASSLSDIYLDLEYVMGILEKYPVNYPIYLDIDGILNHDNLTLETAWNLIQSFLEKAKENNIYIGLYGSEKNQVSGSSFVESDELFIKEYNCQSSFGNIFKENGIYYSNCDLKDNIESSSYNDPRLFQQDGYHVLEENETLQDVARRYGLSVNDLEVYNDTFAGKRKVGDVLRIPSVLQRQNTSLNQDGSQVKVGIDVSLWQDEIEWKDIEVDYAIIQVRDFANQENDPQFQMNVNGCLENNIPFGFYVFSRATTIEAVQGEAEYLLSQIQGLPATYPVYLDLETKFWDSIDMNGCLTAGNYTKEETKAFILEFLQTWEREVKKAGFVPGIYCNYSLYDRLNSVTGGYLDNLQCWIAGGQYYDQEISYTEGSELPVISVEENDKIGMRQISSMGMVSGIDGYVDLNYCYTDYEIGYDWERMNFSKGGNKIKFGVAAFGLSGMFVAWKKRGKRRSRR